MKPSLIVLGRFQPFHNGHASMVEAALEQGVPLRICIGSSAVSYTHLRAHET